jgi:glutaredoxin 3
MSALPTRPRLEIYTKFWCGYCHRAKRLLDAKRIAFAERDVSFDQAGFAEMVGRSGGRRTVPQVFLDDRLLGGCDELHALDSSGELDRLLAG